MKGKNNNVIAVCMNLRFTQTIDLIAANTFTVIHTKVKVKLRVLFAF